MDITKQMALKAALIMALAVAGLLLIPHLNGFLFPVQSVQTLPPVLSYCDVSIGCSVHFSGGSVDLKVTPESMPAMEPLALSVVITGVKASDVSVEFVGRDMPMGLEPVTMRAAGSLADSHRYEGTGMISFCSIDNQMVWLARVNITTKKATQTVVFELDMSRS